MEAYKHETTNAVNRFLHHGLSLPDCLAASDAALARLMHRMPKGELAALRAVMLANNEIVMQEMERRESDAALR